MRPYTTNLFLTQARLNLGLSQCDLALRLSVSSKQVWRWENGIAQPRLYYRQLLCTFFHKKRPKNLAFVRDPCPLRQGFLRKHRFGICWKIVLPIPCINPNTKPFSNDVGTSHCTNGKLPALSNGCSQRIQKRRAAVTTVDFIVLPEMGS